MESGGTREREQLQSNHRSLNSQVELAAAESDALSLDYENRTASVQWQFAWPLVSPAAAAAGQGTRWSRRSIRRRWARWGVGPLAKIESDDEGRGFLVSGGQWGETRQEPRFGRGEKG